MLRFLLEDSRCQQFLALGQVDDLFRQIAKDWNYHRQWLKIRDDTGEQQRQLDHTLGYTSYQVPHPAVEKDKWRST